MNAIRIPLEDWAIPHRRNDFASVSLSKPLNHIFDGVDVSSIREDQSELLFGCLKYAEGGVISAINDLDVLHLTALPRVRNVRNGSEKDVTGYDGWPSQQREG